jgi:hypothetical protein
VITGHVYRVRTTLVNPPKTKIVLCVGNWFLWFNTDARKGVPAQMQVKAGDAPGISKDCHLNCGRITVFPPGELAAATDEGPAQTNSSRALPMRSRTARQLSPIYTGVKFLKPCGMPSSRRARRTLAIDDRGRPYLIRRSLNVGGGTGGPPLCTRGEPFEQFGCLG